MIENLDKIIEFIPTIFELFIPGYILILIFRYFNDSDNEDYDKTILNSLILSYCLKIISTFISSLFPPVKDYSFFISLSLAIISGFVAQLLRRQDWFKNIFTKVSKVAPAKSIWEFEFNQTKGSHIRFSMVFHNKNVIVEGNVHSFQVVEDICLMSIKNYKMFDMNNSLFYDSTNYNCLLIVNSDEISGIEIQTGKK